MNYKDLGAISRVNIIYNENNENEIREIILSYNSGKKLYIKYTRMCCEHSWFEYDESSLSNNDYKAIFIGRTIDSIDHTDDIDTETTGNCDGFKYFGHDHKFGHIYKITFTDNNSITFILYCTSNGYYDSSLETKIE